MIKFSFLPESKVLLISDIQDNHSDTISKFNKQARHVIPFDKWIRGIIKDNVLYLRLFYPLPDIDTKTIDELNEYSFDVLFDNLKNIAKALRLAGIKKHLKCKFNVVNEDLKGIIINI